jgi:hypothetical protein
MSIFLQVLKMKFPQTFGMHRAVFQADEVMEMIKHVENKDFVLKDNILTVRFDVASELDLQKQTANHKERMKNWKDDDGNILK